jgi:hypothetical protein
MHYSNVSGGGNCEAIFDGANASMMTENGTFLDKNCTLFTQDMSPVHLL